MKRVSYLLAAAVIGFTLVSSSAYSHDKMLKSSKEKICSMCHADKDKYFEASGHGKFNVTCQMCHNPHGAGNSTMLKWDEAEFCLQCHGKMKGEYHKTGHGSKNVICQMCHDPHGTGDSGDKPKADKPKAEKSGKSSSGK